ncbi:hypothetical protein [Pseudomonas asiatica]
MKTDKWRLRSTVQAGARELLLARREKQGKLLDIAAQNGKQMEPAGRLCG